MRRVRINFLSRNTPKGSGVVIFFKLCPLWNPREFYSTTPLVILVSTIWHSNDRRRDRNIFGRKHPIFLCAFSSIPCFQFWDPMDPGMLFLTRGGGSDSSPSLTEDEFVLVFLSPAVFNWFFHSGSMNLNKTNDFSYQNEIRNEHTLAATHGDRNY